MATSFTANLAFGRYRRGSQIRVADHSREDLRTWEVDGFITRVVTPSKRKGKADVLPSPPVEP